MILSDRDISWHMRPLENRSWDELQERLVIEPLLEPIQPASVDLRFGGHFILPGGGMIDRRNGHRPEEIVREIEGCLFLSPGSFVNVTTLEHIEIPPHLVGILSGKSSWARDGLQVESAGYVDPGWIGRLTLELKNLGPYIIKLWPGEAIAQIRFETLSSIPIRLYGNPELGSHYQGAELPEMGEPVRRQTDEGHSRHHRSPTLAD
jgi:dCTP deaminase